MIIVILILALIAFAYYFLNQPQFGKIPSGERLKKIKQSANYREGKFQNQHPTSDLTEGATFLGVLREYLFDKNPDVRPRRVLPSHKADLHSLDPASNVIVWFGHSSYFIQIAGKKVLVDPIFSGRSSPVKFTTKSYLGSDVYSVADIPEIDYLFLSHDHWDHLDYETITGLKHKVKRVITGLGVGAHLEHWGIAASKITECDWFEELNLDEGFKVNTAPARHFSGRGLKRNQVLWTSFALTTPCMKIYIGGDSGYDTHYKEIGQKYGPFDLAILECGQYNKNWKYIHMMPEEVVQATLDLQAKILMPVHWAKFALSQHAWDEPINRVVAEAAKRNVPLIHPMIGEVLDLDNIGECKSWWTI